MRALDAQPRSGLASRQLECLSVLRFGPPRNCEEKAVAPYSQGNRTSAHDSPVPSENPVRRRSSGTTLVAMVKSPDLGESDDLSKLSLVRRSRIGRPPSPLPNDTERWPSGCWRARVSERVPWVRIPLSPPTSPRFHRSLEGTARRRGNSRDSAGFWAAAPSIPDRRTRGAESPRPRLPHILRGGVGRFGFVEIRRGSLRVKRPQDIRRCLG